MMKEEEARARQIKALKKVKEGNLVLYITLIHVIGAASWGVIGFLSSSFLSVFIAALACLTFIILSYGLFEDKNWSKILGLIVYSFLSLSIISIGLMNSTDMLNIFRNSMLSIIALFTLIANITADRKISKLQSQTEMPRK